MSGDPSDVFALQDAIDATNWLRRNNILQDEDPYVVFIGVRQRGWLLGMSLLDAWDRNLGRRWAADERRARRRGRGAP
jgi:hypothetical protein